VAPRSEVAVTVPVHTGTDLGRGLAVRILMDAGFTIDDYLRRKSLLPASSMPPGGSILRSRSIELSDLGVARQG
jgi:hypothetical protein